MKKLDVLNDLRDDSKYYGDLGKKFLSNSDIGALLNNPRDFKKDSPDNLNFAKGRYFHQLILEPEKAKDFKFVSCSSRNTKLYKDFLVDNDLTFALLEKEGDDIRSWVDVMMGNFEMYDNIKNPDNKFEVPAIGTIHGKEWKGKADIVHPDCIIDLKTTGDITQFKWSARKYNYDSQCYLYQQLFNKPLVFYVVDKNSKMLGIYEPTPDFVSYGEEKVLRAIEVYDKFFGENKTDNIDTFYYKEFL